MDMIAVFKSRRDAVRLADGLSRLGVSVSVVSTPRGIGVPCGLSVRFRKVHLPLAERVLGGNDYFGFIGFYAI